MSKCFRLRAKQFFGRFGKFDALFFSFLHAFDVAVFVNLLSVCVLVNACRAREEHSAGRIPHLPRTVHLVGIVVRLGRRRAENDEGELFLV